jgi:hypothetical protein
MSAPQSGAVRVVLNLAQALEERMIDWLLAQSANGVFASVPVHGYGEPTSRLSVGEQVGGRTRRFEFQIELAPDELDGFIAALEQHFGQADIRYCAIPVLRQGRLDR